MVSVTASSLPPLGLYVHLPWCVRKCPYCDFNSYALKAALPEADYVTALLRDLDADLDLVANRELVSVFLGGGTPSLFSAAAIRGLLDGIRARVGVAEDVEITLEANPGAAETERFAGYREAGVNRLSIGLQTLRDTMLTALGRVHTADEAVRAVRAARAAGFENINVDLMYGLPGDVLEASLGDLERALGLGPTHVSWYQLTLEPQTHFHRYPPALPDEDAILAIEAAGRSLLAERGLERYEVSAYAKPGYRCRHNVNYWQFGDYVGIGAGAHGKLTLRDAFGIERRVKTRNPRAYVATAGTPAAVRVERVQAPDALATEFLMNALRLLDGVGIETFSSRTGQPLEQLAPGLGAARRKGWMAPDADRLKATPAGMQALNKLLISL